MNILMLSGDNSLARGSQGAFYYMLKRFSVFFERIDLICPPCLEANCQVVHENVFIHPGIISKFLQPFYIIFKGWQLLRTRKYNLIVSHDFGFFYNGLGALVLSATSGIPLVSEVMHVEGYPQAVNFKERIQHIVAKIYFKIFKKRIAYFRAINSKEVPQFLHQCGIAAHKILVLPATFVDLNVFRPLPNIKKQYDLLFVGRLVHNKGIERLIHAVHDLSKRIPSIKMAIRGDGPLKSKIIEEISSLGLSSQIDFVSRCQSQEEMVHLYNSARILVCASTVEGGPRVTFEAMACGVPVICTPVGIMPEVIQHNSNGLIWNGTSEHFVTLLEPLLLHPELAKQIGLAGREVSKQFEYSSIVDHYAKTYLSLRDFAKVQAS